MNLEAQYRKMTDFCAKHGLKTHPLKTLKQWAEVVCEKNHCPCDPKRPECPCPEALDEIESKGKCKCGKFFSPDKWEDIWGWTRDNPNFDLEPWNK